MSYGSGPYDLGALAYRSTDDVAGLFDALPVIGGGSLVTAATQAAAGLRNAAMTDARRAVQTVAARVGGASPRALTAPRRLLATPEGPVEAAHAQAAVAGAAQRGSAAVPIAIGAVALAAAGGGAWWWWSRRKVNQ